MRKKALLIGINDYPDPYKLSGCVEDINCLRLAIEKNGDGSPNFDIRLMPNVQCSGDAMEAIQELFEDDPDVALFYFSGHGYVNTSGAEIVFPNDLRDERNYYNGLQMSNIMNIVNDSRARNKIVILDCCHSGNIGKYNLQSDTSHLNSGVSILTACREDEYAQEIGGHGVFTELLCDALAGGASDFCGNITVGGVYAYIDRSLGAWQQRPVFKTNVVEFVPLKNVVPPVSTTTIRELIELFPNPEDEMPLDPSFEDTNNPSITHKIVEPYADEQNVRKFKVLQKLQSIGFVKPIGCEYMYFAAMERKSCRLTALGKYYWRLVKNGRI